MTPTQQARGFVMQTYMINTNNFTIPCVTTKVAIVGSGTASLNAAVNLAKFGINDIVIITHGLSKGTSAKAGSDKQTYYRLNPSFQSDSVFLMAGDLFNGGAMHGDIALVEAALSTRAFYHLVDIGVPFPHDKYGNYIGYITDHDKKARGTSAGPYTSILMHRALLDELSRYNISIIDNTTAIDILTFENNNGDYACGLLAIDHNKINENNHGLMCFIADYIIVGTGGPGDLFKDSVYPETQITSLGMLLRAGAVVHNLTEMQFGIAAQQPRWNLSGSYQQAIPRYYSTDIDGNEKREFLNDYFPSLESLTYATFLKGYQWPFDVKKINNYGSSCIDLLVYYEKHVLNRRVFIDYRTNPCYHSNTFSLESIHPEAFHYLQNSNALSLLPYQRLQQINKPAFDLFMSKGVDLSKQPLEIAICHQHCNGGCKGNIWWESNIHNLFTVGEINGSHGVYRPGGSALNSGQVGSLRAAQMIAYRIHRGYTIPHKPNINLIVKQKLEKMNHLINHTSTINIKLEKEKIQKRASESLGIIRNLQTTIEALHLNNNALQAVMVSGITAHHGLLDFFLLHDMLIVERCMLEASLFMLERLNAGRGSWCIADIRQLIQKGKEGLIKEITINDCDEIYCNEILEISLSKDTIIEKYLVPVRPIPEYDSWFENVWAEYQQQKFFDDDITSHGG